MQKVIPPPDAIEAREIPFHLYREIPFHLYFDSEFLDRDEKPTRFFVNPRAFADGTPKFWPDECNLGTGGADIPAGFRKEIRKIVVHCKAEREGELFRVQILKAQTRIFDQEMQATWDHAEDVEVKNPFTGKMEFPRLVGMEQFCVDVTPPARLRGQYCRVTLYGPALAARMM